MDKLKLLSTIFSKLESLTKNNGQIIISRDSKSLYVDLEGERIEITDWIDVDTEENLLAILTPLTNKYYYTKDNNKIWRYINNDWKCLNTSVNDLTPTYTESTSLVKLSSGEKLSIAFGKISKAITDLISHIGDSVKHITSTERTNWNSAKTHADSAHAPADAQKNVQSDWSATSGDAYIKNKPTEFPPSIHTHIKSEISDFPSSLPANGGNSDTVNNHTVETDVPVDAVFTDTIYDDTEVKESIAELNSNLVGLEYSEIAGGKNLANINDFKALTSNPSRYGYEWLNMKGGTYTFNITNGNSRLYIGYKHNEDFVNPSSVINNSIVQTITISDGDNIVIWYDEGITENTVTKIQLEVGSVATEYEPYIPSVKMLADEVSAQNESLAYNASKNMLSAIVGTISGVTITSKDKSTALLNGTSTANVSVFTTVDVIPSGSYHLKLSNKVGSMFVWDTIHSKTIIDVDNTECNFTLTEPSKLLVGFSVGNGHSFTNFEASGQLEKGTVATDFVPYNGKSNLELTNDVVSLKNDLSQLEFGEAAGGKNLFKYNEVSGTLSKTVECSLDAGTYTISALVNSSDTDSSTSLIDFYYEDGTNESYLLGRESRTSYTFTLTKHVIALIFYASKDYANSANDTFTYSDIQIEKGTTATDYEPYIPSVEMLAEEVSAQNESLDTLEYSDVAGEKNICKALDNGVVNEITLIKKDVSTIIISGANGSRAISKNVNVKKGVTYTATFFTSSTNITGFLWNSIKQVTAYPFGSSKTITFTPTEDETLNFAVTLTATVSNVEISMQVEKGSKSTSFEPYIPSIKMLAEKPTQIDDLNVLGWVVPEEMPIKNYTDSSGVFHQIVDRVDLGTLNWIYDVSNRQFYTDIIPQIKQDEIWIYDVYCSKYTIASYGDKRIALNGGRIYIADSSYTDGDSLKHNLRGVYFYFELSTPITMNIDGNEAVTQIKNDLGGLSFSVSGTTLSITDGTNTWTLSN